MADNAAITEGLGKSIATDEIAGVNFQRVKLIHGADGVNAGDVSLTNGLPISPMTAPGGSPFPVSPGLKLTESYTRVALSFAGAGDNIILAADATKFNRIYGIILIADTPVSVKLGEGGPTYWTGAMKFGTAGGLILLPQGEPHFMTSAINKSLIVNLSAAVQVSGVLWYQQGV